MAHGSSPRRSSGSSGACPVKLRAIDGRYVPAVPLRRPFLPISQTRRAITEFDLAAQAHGAALALVRQPLSITE